MDNQKIEPIKLSELQKGECFYCIGKKANINRVIGFVSDVNGKVRKVKFTSTNSLTMHYMNAAKEVIKITPRL